MDRRSFATVTAVAFLPALSGCVGNASLSGRDEETDDRDECPDPEISSPMEFEEFDYEPKDITDVAREVVILTSPDDVDQYADETNVPENMENVDFEYEVGIIVERTLTGSWGSHYLLGLEREDAESIKVFACSTGKPEPPKNDVVSGLAFGIIARYDGHPPTEGYLHHYQVD